ncbi:hypothetical protein [Actinoplanes sp. NPDC026619]|uniref:hypothetical protein n=1 Tax=Actinoplanes sp. NPDC026619 TaxID=3155798 RepID=UPI0033DB0DFF
MCDAVLGQVLTDPPASGPAGGGLVTTAVALRTRAPRLDALTPAERQILVEWLDRLIEHGPERRS